LLQLQGVEDHTINIDRDLEMNRFEMVKALTNKYGDSFYVFDKEKLRKNYTKMHTAFSSRYGNFIIGYSYKTNYLPSLIKEMSKLGSYAEVVSRLEYDLALKIGVQPNMIIFNGPLKSYDDIAIALEGDSILNIDSLTQVASVKKYVLSNSNRQYKIGLRVNFDLTVDGKSPLQSGYKQSRFGFCVEDGAFEEVLNELNQITNLSIVGLHGHFSTSIRSLNNYSRLTQVLCDLSRKYLANTLEYLDVGGGFFGDVPKIMNKNDVPSFDDYAETICSIINKEKGNFKNNILLIIEPGLSLVVDTFNFYSKVIDVKKSRDEYFVLVDGSVHNIKPSLHKKNMPMEHVKNTHEIYNKEKFNVVGYTCMEKDYLAINYEGEMPKVGDCLVFSNVGAYTIVLNPPFIKERPPIIAREGSEYSLVRKRESLNDFINDNVYVF